MTKPGNEKRIAKQLGRKKLPDIKDIPLIFFPQHYPSNHFMDKVILTLSASQEHCVFLVLFSESLYISLVGLEFMILLNPSIFPIIYMVHPILVLNFPLALFSVRLLWIRFVWVKHCASFICNVYLRF